MITYIHNEEKQVGDSTYVWFIGNCLSTDFKPVVGIYEASKLFELDTLKTFVYDAGSHTWQETASGGGLGLHEFREIMSHAFAIDNIYIDSNTDTSNIYLEHSYDDLEKAVYAAVFISNGAGAVNRFPLYRLEQVDFTNPKLNIETTVYSAVYGFGDDEYSVKISFIANSISEPLGFNAVYAPSDSDSSGEVNPGLPINPNQPAL